MKLLRVLHIGAVAGATALFIGAMGAPARAQEAPAWSQLPLSVTLGVERVALPAGERMGLVGGSLLLEAAPGSWVGPAVYGAATGRRAGLFVGGIEAQRRWALGGGLQAAAGLYAGGGGGGGAPVGDGLMLRPAASLMMDLGGWQAGLSLSGTRFAGTSIGGTQLGLVLAWDGRYRYTDAARAGALLPDARGSGLGWSQAQFGLATWQLQDGSGRRIGLASGRALHPTAHEGVEWGFEMGAAASGGAAGYMEILGSLAVHTEVAAGLRAGARASLGLGGGGALASGGGGLAKFSATLGWTPAPGWQLMAEGGLVRGAGGMPRARSVQLWLGHDLEPGGRGSGHGAGSVSAWEWTAGVQRLQHAARSDGRRGPIDLVSGKVDRQLSPGLYLSAQAHSAFGGDAGAYSAGLLGVGLSTPAGAAPWRVGAEALVGAGGGAAVSTGGGAIGQALAWASWASGAHSHLKLGYGRVRALRGGGALDSPVLELSYSRRFGLGAP